MKHIIPLATILVFSIGSVFAQTSAEFEGDIRILDNTPSLRFHDESDIHLGSLFGYSNNSIYLSSLVNDLRLTSANKILFSSVNIQSNSPKSDFMIRHESGSSAEHGFTLVNRGGNDKYWTFYVKDGSDEMTLSLDGAVVGSFTASGYAASSDKRLKKNIKPLKSVMLNLLSLRPKKYDFIASDNPKKSIGFIAQDVMEYFPELVLDSPSDDGEAMLQVHYAGFGVLAIKAIQEQQEQIEHQGQMIESQEQRIASQEERIRLQNSALHALEAQVNNLITRTAVLEKGERDL